jgi:hypothetical protein
MAFAHDVPPDAIMLGRATKFLILCGKAKFRAAAVSAHGVIIVNAATCESPTPPYVPNATLAVNVRLRCSEGPINAKLAHYGRLAG